MRAATIKTISYTPENIPGEAKELPYYLFSELIRISAAISALADGHIEITHVTPEKPRDGDIRLADGTDWNPGSGKGVYAYYNSAWHLLG